MTRLQRINLTMAWLVMAVGAAFLAYLSVAAVRAGLGGDAAGVLLNAAFGLMVGVGVSRAVRQRRRVQAELGESGDRNDSGAPR